jgi:ferredoxin
MPVDWSSLEKQIQDTARQWLDSGEVALFIGYEKGNNIGIARPAFIRKAEDASRLVYDNGCLSNLTRYLVEEIKRKPKRGEEPDIRPIAIVVKPCDSKTIIELMKENIVPRERVKILGVINSDTINPKKLRKLATQIPLDKHSTIKITHNDGKFNLSYEGGNLEVPEDELLADKCKVCVTRKPVIHDVMIGEDIYGVPKPDDFPDLKEFENMSLEEKWGYWQKQFDRCVRCYACRDACPLCYCEECVFDREKPYKWNEKTVATPENTFYHIIRAMHLAGRCIDCGECERVCPMDIPIRQLNRFLIKAAKERFKIRAGMNAEDKPMFGDYDIGDPEEMIW